MVRAPESAEAEAEASGEEASLESCLTVGGMESESERRKAARSEATSATASARTRGRRRRGRCGGARGDGRVVVYQVGPRGGACPREPAAAAAGEGEEAVHGAAAAAAGVGFRMGNSAQGLHEYVACGDG